MSNKKQSYKIEDWTDVEHCVYHALTDDPGETGSDRRIHRIAHVVSRMAATLVEQKLLTEQDLEDFLISCRS